MSTLEQCEKFFGTRDVYAVFSVTKEATEQQIKKAYYKLSLQVHPDRVAEDEKAESTEKFKLLSKLYQVLSDKNKRGAYDDHGIIDDEDDYEGKLTSWLELWRTLFKPITEDDISNYENTYIYSDLERSDMKKAYLSGKGCINHMMNEVPFLKVEDEPRLQEIIRKMIDAGEVPEYKIFTEEPKQKRQRRHKKYARESKEAEEIKKRLAAKRKAADDKAAEEGGNSLEQQIMRRNKAREGNFDTLMDRLMAKYGGEDDSDCVDFEKLNKNKAKKKKAPAGGGATSKGKKGKETDEKLHDVRGGKVKKQKGH